MVKIDIRSVALLVNVLIIYGRNDRILTSMQPIFLLEASHLIFHLVIRSWDRFKAVAYHLVSIDLISSFIIAYDFFGVDKFDPIVVFVVQKMAHLVGSQLLDLLLDCQRSLEIVGQFARTFLFKNTCSELWALISARIFACTKSGRSVIKFLNTVLLWRYQ